MPCTCFPLLLPLPHRSLPARLRLSVPQVRVPGVLAEPHVRAPFAKERRPVENWTDGAASATEEQDEEREAEGDEEKDRALQARRRGATRAVARGEHSSSRLVRPPPSSLMVSSIPFPFPSSPPFIPCRHAPAHRWFPSSPGFLVPPSLYFWCILRHPFFYLPYHRRFSRTVSLARFPPSLPPRSTAGCLCLLSTARFGPARVVSTLFRHGSPGFLLVFRFAAARVRGRLPAPRAFARTAHPRPRPRILGAHAQSHASASAASWCAAFNGQTDTYKGKMPATN
ncbi:hypothetical protein FB451DRAFT_1563815 [Mycena latifolia]|nr:hypothetical protein FB451DRAFT_1563815 [Mycena latifolia]